MVINFFKKMFKKEEEVVDFPSEFGLVTFMDEARLYGIFDDSTKEIRHYMGKEHIDYPYTHALLEAMEEFGLPTHNITREQVELPIIKRINPEEVRNAAE